MSTLYLRVYIEHKLLRVVHNVAITALALKLEHIVDVPARRDMIRHVVYVPNTLWVIIEWSRHHVSKPVSSPSCWIIWAAWLILLLLHFEKCLGVNLCCLLWGHWDIGLVSFAGWGTTLNLNSWRLSETWVRGLWRMLVYDLDIIWRGLLVIRLHQMTSIWKIMRRNVCAWRNLNLSVAKTVEWTWLVPAKGLLLRLRNITLLSLAWSLFSDNDCISSLYLNLVFVLTCQFCS